jgi:hypothetical protein
MKYLFKIALYLFAVGVVSSCRNADDIPEDIHEHEEIEKLVVTVLNKNDATDIQIINYIGGVADGHLHMQAGNIYGVKLDFQVRHDDHYHSVNEEIIEEREEHFITYEFAGSEVVVKRTANDIVRADGKRLGLDTEFTINSLSPTGAVIIKLVHAPATVDENFPSVANQQGKTSGGETDVNAKIALD